MSIFPCASWSFSLEERIGEAIYFEQSIILISMKTFDRNEIVEEDVLLQFDVMKYVRIAKKYWKRILLWGICSAVLGVAFSFTFPKGYKVVTKLAPELSLRSNSLTSLASMAGINMSMLGNNNDALLPTVYPEIVSSVPFITDLFDMPVGEKTLYDYMQEDQKASLIGTVFSLPGRITDAIKDFVSNSSEEDIEEDIPIDSFRLTAEQYAVYKSIVRSISIVVDKKTFIVTITVFMQDSEVAASLAKEVCESLRKYVIKYRTEKTQQVVDYLNVVVESSRQEYFEAQANYARYADSHQGITRQSEQLESLRLQNIMNLKYQLYSSLSQQLQQSTVQLHEEAPVFAEIVPSTVPLRKAEPQRKKFMISFFILGLAIGFGISLKKDK